MSAVYKAIELAHASDHPSFWVKGDYCDLVFVRRSPTLLVSFDNLASINERTEERPWPAWMGARAKRLGYSILSLQSHAKDWYRTPEPAAQIEALKAQGFFDGFEQILFIGTSMGGFAALCFAGLVPGAKVLAFSPQSTLNRQIAPFERRYPWPYKKFDWESPAFLDAAEHVGKIASGHVFFDPMVTEDKLHAERLVSSQLKQVAVPYAGHTLIRVLVKSSAFDHLLGHYPQTGTVDTEFFQRLRNKRNDTKWARHFLNDARKRRSARMFRSAAGILQKNHGNNYAAKLIAKLDRAGAKAPPVSWVTPMDRQSPLNGRVRRCEGAIVIVAFDELPPAAWRTPDRIFKILHGEITAMGRVLPVGSSNRIVFRTLETDLNLQSGESVTITPEATFQENVPDFDDLKHLRFVTEQQEPELLFSVFTLVRNVESYKRLLAAFAARKFTAENTEFIALDNRDQNNFDGYAASRHAAAEARGRFVILCHDDIEPVEETAQDLLERLADLEETDPLWMVAGVAGGPYNGSNPDGKRRVLSRITDRWGPARRVGGPFPRRVESLDECFLIFPRNRMPQSSIDLKGFHFFATDLCFQAELAGGTAYVIDFHLLHYGKAQKGDDYYQLQTKMITKYRSLFPGRYVGTTTRPLDFRKD